jgi:hypothetical protein
VSQEVSASEVAQPTPADGPDATVEQGEGIELTDADRRFLDYLAEGAVRLYLARSRSKA